MSETHDEIRALRVMVGELRAEPAPALPWDAIEARVLSRIAEPAPRARGSALASVLGFTAAAAVLAFGVGSMTRSAELEAAAPSLREIQVSSIRLASGDSTAHDLSALRAGDVVTAGDAPVSFAEAGLVEWTLAPGSALRVRSTGSPLFGAPESAPRPSSPAGVGYTVVLERGSLRAEVTPRAPSEGLVEAFAVEVEGTRIAVHGTAFSVQVEASSVVVDVEHGAVAVGPVGHVGATTGHLLVGPSRASFSLDGGRSARWLEIPAAPAALALAPEARGDAVPTPDAPPAESLAKLAGAPTLQLAPAARTPARPPVARVPAPEPPRLTVDLVRARLDRCFRQTSEAGSPPAPVRVSVSSTLRIEVNLDGSVRSARFDPPLKPELVQCAGSAIAGRFADDAGHVDIPVSFQAVYDGAASGPKPRAPAEP